MDADEDALGLGSSSAPSAPGRVSLPPFSPNLPFPSPRRLSSRFSQPSRPAPPARRNPAWVSLQGRLVGAEEATSARFAAPGLSRHEAAAWELFSPLHRVLIVAVVATATWRSERSRKVAQLQRSIDLRDEVLLSMQQKLDDLCEEMNSLQDQSVKCNSKSVRLIVDTKLEEEGDKFSSFMPKLNRESGITPLSMLKDVNGTESLKDEKFEIVATNLVEQEERRMSDLSDFCWSVTSSVDNQLNSLAVDQEFYNLRKECEEKDATIKELSAAAQVSSIAASKRIAELQEIVKRKNMIISKLKKDMMFLEQKVVVLTRMKRASSVASKSNNTPLPVMASNILYDMSSTSPSSSDSESPKAPMERITEASVDYNTPKQEVYAAIGSQRQPIGKTLVSSCKSSDRNLKQRSVSPLQENQLIEKAETTPLMRQRKSASSGGDYKRTKRSIQQEAKSTAQRRWV
ncbi:uncharacterized protein LOC109726586 [Ananas comosus]|uniref:Uncharacterized protein LOC109726586 n=1 Tax=Ananas comosus TaxID=4615 RepID=A0A6P5H1D0_ANACO|nr:uncharacterized protein LOC109726586 [Ananas comosus]XP_020111862.1 uncharacterized protein LOC109726586 [Ananas comosus]XP_020111871.1 uncharacterized protein LOC109726586 [Ananas comosus]XP_020111880.1 uncharacterized protein LOC109726586 [Ananas comosus]XP_020111890.1 uncharacterized protein LOC109726586 [Ananas comosus]